MSMRRVACLAAALGAAAVLAPDVAAARGWHGGYGFGFYGGPAFYGPRPYFGYYGGYYLPPPVVFAPPPVYYAPPIVSYPQPTYIVPPAGYAPPAQQPRQGYVPQQQNLAPGVSQKFGGMDGGLKQ